MNTFLNTFQDTFFPPSSHRVHIIMHDAKTPYKRYSQHPRVQLCHQRMKHFTQHFTDFTITITSSSTVLSASPFCCCCCVAVPRLLLDVQRPLLAVQRLLLAVQGLLLPRTTSSKLGHFMLLMQRNIDVTLPFLYLTAFFKACRAIKCIWP